MARLISSENLIKKVRKEGIENISINDVNRFMLLSGDFREYDVSLFFHFLQQRGLSYKKLSKICGVSVGLLQHWARGYIKFSQWKRLIKLIYDKYNVGEYGIKRFDREFKIEDFIRKI